MSPIVVDNYVSFNSFQTLKKGFMGSKFPWFYNPHVLTDVGEDEEVGETLQQFSKTQNRLSKFAEWNV